MQRTPVAVLGTLAEFHKEPIPYDLNALIQLVTRIRPEMLCLDITQKEWTERKFDDLPPEYREALLPLAYQTDMVVVPIAGAHPPIEPKLAGGRGKLVELTRRWLAFLQRTAPGPDSINSGIRHHIADALYSFNEWLAGIETRQAFKQHTIQLTQAVLNLARRDPAARILVVVTVRHCHHIRKALRKHSEIRVLMYSDL